MKFSQNLKYLRKTSNLTQKQIADKLNVTDAAIRGWENKGKEPCYEILIKLAEIFDITIGQLIGSEELY